MFILSAVIHVRILSKSRLEGGRRRHDVLIKKVYKSSLMTLMRREYIWVYSPCCPRLRRGREYLVMGRKRKVRFQRGQWVGEGISPQVGVQYQTRLVVDYMDYWRTWRSRYDSKMDQYSEQKCEKYEKPQSIQRDPERNPKNKRSRRP